MDYSTFFILLSVFICIILFPFSKPALIHTFLLLLTLFLRNPAETNVLALSISKSQPPPPSLSLISLSLSLSLSFSLSLSLSFSLSLSSLSLSPSSSHSVAKPFSPICVLLDVSFAYFSLVLRILTPSFSTTNKPIQKSSLPITEWVHNTRTYIWNHTCLHTHTIINTKNYWK